MLTYFPQVTKQPLDKEWFFIACSPAAFQQLAVAPCFSEHLLLSTALKWWLVSQFSVKQLITSFKLGSWLTMSFPSGVYLLIQAAQKVSRRNAGKHSGYICTNDHQQIKYSQALSLALKSSSVAEVRSVWLHPLHPSKQKSCIQAAPCEQFLACSVFLTVAQHYPRESFSI